MSWREDLKVGLLRADSFFIGTANGGLGTDVTAALLALAAGGTFLTTDLVGDILADDETNVVLENGTDGTDAEFTGDVNAENGAALLVSGATPSASYLAAPIVASDLAYILQSRATPGAIPVSLDDAEIYAGRVNAAELYTYGQLGVPERVRWADSNTLGDTPVAVMEFDNIAQIGLRGLSLATDEIADIVTINGIVDALGNIRLYFEDAFLHDDGGSGGLVMRLFSPDFTEFLNYGTDGTDAWYVGVVNAQDGAAIVEGLALAGAAPVDITDSLFNIANANLGDEAGSIRYANPESNHLKCVLKALNSLSIIDSIATAGQVPTGIDDVRISYAHLVPQSSNGAAGAWDGKAAIIPIQSAATITGFTPQYIGQRITIWCADSTGDAVAVCGAGVTWDGTNDTATFADNEDAIEAVAVSLTRWLVTSNIGVVVFS